MKGIKKIVLSLLAMFALVLVIQVPTQAGSSGGVVATTSGTAITVSWPAVNKTGYTIDKYVVKDSNGKILWSGLSTSATIEVGKGYVGSFWVYYSYTTSTGYKYDSGYVGYSTGYSKPVNIKSTDYKTYVMGYTGTPYIQFQLKDGKNPQNASGIQVKITNLKSKKSKVVNMTYTVSDKIKISKNAAYKYQFRVYCINDNTNGKIYGDWSSVRYFCSSDPTFKIAGSNKVKVTLKKISGVSSYTVYISKKETSGFKKVKTVKMSKSSASITVSKCGSSKLKKYVDYYIKVVPTLKVSGKKVTVDPFMDGFYIKTVYK